MSYGIITCLLSFSSTAKTVQFNNATLP